MTKAERAAAWASVRRRGEEMAEQCADDRQELNELLAYYGRAECLACGEFELAEAVIDGRCAWCREHGREVEAV